MLGPHSPNRDTIPDMAVPILDATKWWECPSCSGQHVTQDLRTITPMHHCRAMKGLLVPYVQVHNNHGIRRGTVRLVALERQDFEGAEKGLRHDGDGKPVFAVHTERADGSNDCHVFPAVATTSASAHK